MKANKVMPRQRNKPIPNRKVSDRLQVAFGQRVYDVSRIHDIAPGMRVRVESIQDTDSVRMIIDHGVAVLHYFVSPTEVLS
jgi:hypothetical protein